MDDTGQMTMQLLAKKQQQEQSVLKAPAAPGVASGLDSGVQMYTGPRVNASAPAAAPAPAPSYGQPVTSSTIRGQTTAPVKAPTNINSIGDLKKWHDANSTGLRQMANSQQAARGGYTGTEYTTGLYDPTDTKEQYDYQGNEALGDFGGMNDSNIGQARYMNLFDASKQASGAVGQAAGSRATADASYAAKPTASRAAPSVADALSSFGQGSAPAPYQAGAAPGFNINPSGTDDVIQAAQQYGVQLGNPSGPQAPVGADSVAGGGAAFASYATGAQNSFLDALHTSMGKLTDNAAAHGRLKTGFLTQDQGNLGRAVSSSFDNDMLTHALDAATLDQQAATGNADRKLTADQGNASRGQQGSQFALSFAGDQATRQDQNKLAYNNQDYGQYADQRNYGEADQQQQYNQFDENRKTALGAEGQDYDQYANGRDFDQNVYTSDRDFTQGVATTDQNEADAQRSFYTGLLDNAQGQVQQADADKKANSGFAGFMKNVVSPIVSTASSVAGIINPVAGAAKAVKKIANPITASAGGFQGQA